ncbi:MAG: DUF4255 domain-containing protein [Cyanobacteria bacterium P01_F01_bin.86]
MSNYLAIATVTAALRSLLVEHAASDIVGTDVTIKRPAAPSDGLSGPAINIYMYQATPNHPWSNRDLRAQRPNGDLIKQSQTTLDLNYVLSFYGDESQLIPQKLLGSTIRTLIDYPLLSQDMIKGCVANAEILGLEDSTLANQLQIIRFVPNPITTQDLSQIWSTFFQVPYSLSFICQATAVQIEGKKEGRAALPVRRRVVSIAKSRPTIKKIDLQEHKRPITLASDLVVRGQQLMELDHTEVRIGKSRIRPKSVQNNQLLLQFSQLTDSEIAELRPGVQGLQIFQTESLSPQDLGHPRSEMRSVESNVIPIVLCPTIVNGSEGISKIYIEENFSDDRLFGLLSVQTDLLISPQQKAFLLLNCISSGKSRSSNGRSNNDGTYIFRAKHRHEDTRLLNFEIENVCRGKFLVRIQVDGAESPLLHNGKRYTGPLVTLETVETTIHSGQTISR